MGTTGNLLGQNLRRLRERRGWTQAQLAERADLSVKMVQKIEHAQSSPSIATLDTLCKALDVTPAELFAGQGQVAIPTYSSAAEFLSRFEGLSPALKRLVLGLVYQDPSYGKGIRLNPEFLASIQGIVGPLPKAK